VSGLARILVAVCLGIGGVGCADETRQPAATPAQAARSPDPRPLPVRMEREEVHAALRRWIDCANRHIQRMDDGKRDQQTLTALVVDRCRPEFNAYIDVTAEGLTNADRSELRRRVGNRDVYYVSGMIAGRRRSG
jgi:hypothetical protein